MLTLLFVITFALIGPCTDTSAASPTFVFGEDAHRLLDSLQSNKSDDFLTMGILAHNISFREKDKDMTEKAKDFLSSCADSVNQHTRAAYQGTLKLLKIRDKAKINAAISTVCSFFGGESLYTKARKAFGEISEALAKDSTNIEIRFLRANVAVEIAEHLPELLDTALVDLDYLSREMCMDSVQLFYFHLTWAKYCYKFYVANPKDHYPLSLGRGWVEMSTMYVQSSSQRKEYELWSAHIADAMTKHKI